MVKKFLKIAGVKTEAEFYKKYPTEAAFFKAHPDAKDLKKHRQGGQQKKLDQLTNFTNDPDNIIPMAQDGQMLPPMESTPPSSIDLNLPRYEQPKGFFTGYGFSQNVAPAVDVHGIGAYGERSVSDRLKLTGNITSPSVVYPGGNRMFMNPNVSAGFKYRFDDGGSIPTAQGGGLFPGDPSLALNMGQNDPLSQYNLLYGSGTPPISGAGAPVGGQTPASVSSMAMQGAIPLQNLPGTPIDKPLDIVNPKKFDFGKLAGPVGKIIGGIQEIKDARLQKKEAEKQYKLSDVVAKAASTRPEPIRRRYARPEDELIHPDEMFPTYGVGTNVLTAQDGADVTRGDIGGNPTEVQNMYNPYDLFENLGYEPLEESERIKQYNNGGGVFGSLDVQSLGSRLGAIAGGGGQGEPGGWSQIGSTMGGLLGPAGSFFGGAIGSVIDGRTQAKIRDYQRRTGFNIGNAMMSRGMQGIQNQLNPFMKEGGYVSHNWNPQVIAKWGDVDVSDVHNIFTEGMDTLRTGGRITQNQMFPQDQFAFGGQLKTHWGGKAETMSQNPYLPSSGETVMFKGNSHDESDGKGRTGIGVSYGDTGHDSYTDYAEFGTDAATDKANVEVERNEPAIEMGDNMVVYGNLKIPNQYLSEIGDPKAKGKKFKHYVRDLSNQENKLNKSIDKNMKLIEDTDDITSFGQMMTLSANANIIGANMKLKQIAEYKQNAAAVQNAINDTAEEMSNYFGREVKAEDLSKGKFKMGKPTEDFQARLGKSVARAQDGKRVKYKSDDAEFDSIIDYILEYEQMGSGAGPAGYVGGGTNYGTNKSESDLKKLYPNLPDTKARAKQYYKDNYWKKVKDLPPILRGRALQLAVNTGDPYGELMVAATGLRDVEPFSTEERIKTKLTRKDLSPEEFQGTEWKDRKDSIIKAFNENPEQFLENLNAEQNRYYNVGLQGVTPEQRQYLTGYYEGLDPLTRLPEYSQSPMLQMFPSLFPGDPSLSTDQPISTMSAVSQAFPFKPAQQTSQDPQVAPTDPQQGAPAVAVSPIVQQQDPAAPVATSVAGPGDEEEDDEILSTDLGEKATRSEMANLRKLYEAAKKQKKGDAVVKFQKEFHRLFPKAALKYNKETGFLTAKAKKLGVKRDDLSKIDIQNLQGDLEKRVLEGNEDTYFGDITEKYMEIAEGYDKPRKPKKGKIIVPGEEPKKTTTTTTYQTIPPRKTTWMDVANQLIPYLRPTDQEVLDPAQLYGEMYALATNRVEPVQAKLYNPLLQQPYDISYQDQLNEITASERTAQRMAGQNPAAGAMIASQAGQAKGKVLAQQFRDNQAMRTGVYAANRDALNQARLQNLQILDQQMVRQETAKSRTKEINQAALNSISDKILKNKLENRTLGVYENLYNYRFDRRGRAINMNPLYQPYIPNITGNIPVLDSNGNVIAYQKTETTTTPGTTTSTTTAAPTETTQRKGGKTPLINRDLVRALKRI